MAGSTQCNVALCQAAAKPLDVVHNLAKITEGIKRAAGAGADLVIFGELFLSEYSSVAGADTAANLKKVAEEKYGPSFMKISAAAKENGNAVVYGYPEVDKSSCEEKYYNSAHFVDKNGSSLLNYRKVHLWAPTEGKNFTPGSESPVVNWNGINIGILICYDLDFPETLRSLALKGAKFVPVLTATADMQYDNISKIIVPAKALENQLYLAYTNYVGGPYIGLSHLSNPLGRTVVCAGSEQAMLVAQISIKTTLSS